MGYKIGKVPYSAHRSNVGFRGLLHRIFGKKLRIPRNALGTRQEPLTPIRHQIGRPIGSKSKTKGGYAIRTQAIKEKYGGGIFREWGKKGGNPILLQGGKG